MYTNVANYSSANLSSGDHGRSTGEILGITFGSISGGISVIIAVVLLMKCCSVETIRKILCRGNSSNTYLCFIFW